MGTFDGKTVLLAGKYIARPDSYRSALIVSRDGGKTLVDSAPWLGGCDAYSLFILNKTTAWLVTCWSIEGQQAPFNIFRTTDAARTWKKVGPDLPLPGDFGTSLCRMETIHFKDAKHGQAIFSGSVNVNIKAYETKDGGEHWKVSFNHMHKEVKKDFVASDVIEFPKQPKRNVPEFKVETNYDGNRIVILTRKSGAKKWTQISQLPLYHKLLDYRIHGTDLVPDPKHHFP